jgi:hypothetical protein
MTRSMWRRWRNATGGGVDNGVMMGGWPADEERRERPQIHDPTDGERESSHNDPHYAPAADSRVKEGKRRRPRPKGLKDTHLGAEGQPRPGRLAQRRGGASGPDPRPVGAEA